MSRYDRITLQETSANVSGELSAGRLRSPNGNYFIRLSTRSDLINLSKDDALQLVNNILVAYEGDEK